jgi:cell division protein FtsW
VFPVSGQPLPLISKGGTSIIVTSVAFAIMLSISRTIANQNSKNNKTEEAQLPDDLRAENPTQMIRENEWK